MRNHALFLTIMLIAAMAQADTVTLKTGEEYEGKVIRNTDEEVVMVVEVTGSITDEMTFRKEEVRAVVVTPPDLVAFRKLAGHQVEAHSKSLDFYDRAIAACESFQSLFPDSAHQQQVVNQIRSLKEERERLIRSDIKVAHRWYIPAEAQRERYQIDAELLLQQIRDHAAREDWVAALNAFDQLEREHAGASAYPRAVPLALGCIRHLQAAMARMVPVAKHQQKEFEEKVRFAFEPEKSRMLSAYQTSVAGMEASFRQSTAKWKPLYPAMDQSVAALTATAASETERLSALQTEPMVEGSKLVDAARELLGKRRPDEALLRLNGAAKVWGGHEALPRLVAQAGKLKEVLRAEKEAKEKADAAAAREKELEAMEAGSLQP